MLKKDSKSNKTKENVKLLKPKNDIVFQNLFTKNNVGITKAFAEALLEEKIDKISINEDKELLRENPNDKLGILDLELDVNNNEKVDVEIQLVDKKTLFNVYYSIPQNCINHKSKKGLTTWTQKE